MLLVCNCGMDYGGSSLLIGPVPLMPVYNCCMEYGLAHPRLAVVHQAAAELQVPAVLGHLAAGGTQQGAV